MSQAKDHGSETTVALASVALPCIFVLLVMACCHSCCAPASHAAVGGALWFWEELLTFALEMLGILGLS